MGTKFSTGLMINSPGLSPSLNVQTLSQITSLAEAKIREKVQSKVKSLKKVLDDFYAYNERNRLLGGEVRYFDNLFVKDDEGNIDYDQLAMEQYQFETGAEEIEKYRLGIMEQVEALYASGDFSTLSAQLKEFGYGTAEIATIIASKSMTMTAILDGNTRNILSQKEIICCCLVNHIFKAAKTTKVIL